MSRLAIKEQIYHESAKVIFQDPDIYILKIFIICHKIYFTFQSSRKEGALILLLKYNTLNL